MIRQRRQRLQLLLLAMMLSACGSGGVDIGPTIGDLADLPPIVEAAELEPQANFELDRQQVIDRLRELVAITTEGEGTGDELRRLADLELEASLDKRLADDPATQQLGQQEALHAISIYENYLQQYPGRENNDKILYQMSRAYALESEIDKSMAALDRIVNEYPASIYMDEVQFRRGENLFVEREHVAAELAYGYIVENDPDSIFFEKALYKYGWSQFKQGRFEDAQASFIRLLDINRENDNIREIDFNPALSRANQELLEDVIRVVAISFTYQEDIQYITQYFRQNGKRDYEPLLYRKLGEIYLEKERVFDGANLFLGYTREYPYSQHSPYFHQRVIETYQQAGYSDLVLKEKIAFVDSYNVGTEYWSRQLPQTQQALTPTLVLHTTDLATHFHALARQSKKLPDYAIAASWYRRFLKSFPNDASAPKMNFLLAEILYDAGQYAQAIDEFEKTAYDYEPHENSAEAGYAALTAYDALFKASPASSTQVLHEQRMHSAVRFTTRFSGDSRVQDVELQSAKQFLAWKQYPAAIASATRLLGNSNADKTSRQTARSILADAQFSTGDFAAAEKSYLALLQDQPKQGDQRQAVREQVAASIYKQGELARDAGDLLLAVEHFTRLGTVIPESPTRIVAEYDAATAYVQLEDWPATIAQLEAFRKRYPDDKKFNSGVSEKLALAYSKNGNLSKAAAEMLMLSSLPGPAERKRDLMWRAAELYERDGQAARTIAIYKDYVRTYPIPLDRSMELRHKIAESYRASNDGKNLNFWLNDIVRADAQGGAERNERSRYLAATASLELIEPLRRSYSQVKLTVPLKASLNKKKKLMQQSVDAYSKAMAYQVQEVTTAATFQVAEIYREFARSLMSSQRPSGLDQDQLEEYDLLLEEQAFPFEEKAIEIHLANFRRIPSGTYDDFTQQSLRVLGEMLPYRYARAESNDIYVEIQ
jgi:tetratricopeptide (TPR) repeat protein